MSVNATTSLVSDFNGSLQYLVNRSGRDFKNEVFSYKKWIYCDGISSKNNDSDIGRMAALNYAESVFSIAEMADSLSTKKQSFNFIVVCGHGSGGVQALGSDDSEFYVKGKDFSAKNLDDIIDSIELIYKSIKNDTKPYPVLFLAGCEVGSNVALIKKMSRVMKNVLLVASENPMTYKKQDQSILIKRLVRKNPSNQLIDFQFALNGRILFRDELKEKSGHDDSLLEIALTTYDE